MLSELWGRILLLNSRKTFVRTVSLIYSDWWSEFQQFCLPTTHPLIDASLAHSHQGFISC